MFERYKLYFQEQLSYIITVNFIDGGNRSTEVNYRQASSNNISFLTVKSRWSVLLITETREPRVNHWPLVTNKLIIGLRPSLVQIDKVVSEETIRDEIVKIVIFTKRLYPIWWSEEQVRSVISLKLWFF